MVGSNVTHWDYPRRTKSIQLMVSLGIEHGMSTADLLAGSGITPELFQQPLAEVEASQELRVIRNLQQGCAHVAGLGLLAGKRYLATSYDELGYGFMSSETLLDAVRFLVRFRRLTALFVGMHLEEGPDTTSLVLDASAIPADVRQFVLERDMVAIRMPLLGLFSREAPPLEKIELNFSAPAYRDLFGQAFFVEPVFGQGRNSISVSSSALMRAPQQANPTMFRQCEAMCQQQLDERRNEGGVAARVRRRLLAAHDAFADMELISSEFEMTSRTLRRHLQAEGTSFRTVLDEVREVMADELFRRHPITVEEVASRLGFAEASSFISAFKRWKGVSPRQVYRRGRMTARRETT
ncbi:MAG: AraC family transcriptional regulator [Burkholderiaceae bacterium]|nr:AraC family transcriptional regulator [Burkholderiaceae bacterium]